VDGNPGAAAGQRTRDRTPDAARGAGHECGQNLRF